MNVQHHCGRLRRAAAAFCVMLIAACLFHGPVQAQDRGNAAFAAGDYAAAREIWRELASKGDANAQFNLGVLYDEGLGVPANPELARSFWQQAAENGLAPALHSLALLEIDLSEDGRGDLDKAHGWPQQAAEAGHLPARYTLGKVYEYGVGVDVDPAMALTHISQAARDGYARAQYSLGKIYRDGSGVEAAEAVSLAWFRRAAQNGHIDGQDHYARRLWARATTDAEKSEALGFAILAARAGHSDALELMDKLKGEAGFAELNTGFAFADSFHPRAITGPVTP